MNGRKAYEYGAAVFMTGMVIPSIYRFYDKTFNKTRKKLSISLQDAVNMADELDFDFLNDEE